MKKLIYIAVLCLICSFQQANAQETGSAKAKPDTVKANASSGANIILCPPNNNPGSQQVINRPLVVLNDEVIEYAVVKGIDPNKINTVTILKDASATALYGKPGANGVIIITTKDYVPKKNNQLTPILKN